MRSKSATSSLGTFLLGFLCAALVALLWRLDTPKVLQADSASSGAAGHIIAVTGSDNNGLGVIYMINAKDEKVAAYQWDRNYLYLLAVRDCKSDFEIELFNNDGRKKITPAMIREEIYRKAKREEK
jgi:hypothetical protein